jgi:Lar family restriction alleviation protein
MTDPPTPPEGERPAPCPFCGTDARLSYSGSGVALYGYQDVFCTARHGDCGASLRADTTADALAKWNRRASVQGRPLGWNESEHPGTEFPDAG